MAVGAVVVRIFATLVVCTESHVAPVVEDLRDVGTIDYSLGESGLAATGKFAVGTSHGNETIFTGFRNVVSIPPH